MVETQKGVPQKKEKQLTKQTKKPSQQTLLSVSNPILAQISLSQKSKDLHALQM